MINAGLQKLDWNTLALWIFCLQLYACVKKDGILINIIVKILELIKLTQLAMANFGSNLSFLKSVLVDKTILNSGSESCLS